MNLVPTCLASSNKASGRQYPTYWPAESTSCSTRSRSCRSMRRSATCGCWRSGPARTGCRTCPACPRLQSRDSLESPSQPGWAAGLPTHTPPDAIKRLTDAYGAAVNSPTIWERIDMLGYEPVDDTAGRSATLLRDEIEPVRDAWAGGLWR